MSEGSGGLIETIISNTYTVQDLERRLGVLRSCVEAALFTDTALTYLEECALYLANQASELDACAIKEWGETVLSVFSQSNINARMKELYEASERLPVFTIYLPVEFPEPELKSLCEWCRGVQAASTILDVHVDASVVGGCGVVAHDTYHDLSFEARKQEFPDLVANVLNQYAGE